MRGVAVNRRAFTAPETDAGRLDLSEVQYPENNRTATQMKSFSLVRA